MTDPRYHRQAILPEVGAAGQERLRDACVLIVGCGALGCALADTLARAGVGRLVIVDRDVVELSNLQRQILFDERDAADLLPKAHAAARRLRAVNSAIRVEPHVLDFTSANARTLLTDAAPSLILDGTDNFETRYLLNDLSVSGGIPYAYAGVLGAHAMQATFRPPTTACLRCVFPDPPAPGSTPTCETAGVFLPAVSIAAACQASDAVKLLLGRPELLSPTLLELDLFTNQRRRIELGVPSPGCPCCALRRFEFLESPTHDSFQLCGHNAVQLAPPRATSVDLGALGRRWGPLGRVAANPFLARLTLADSGVEITVFPDARAVIKGAAPDQARSLYARYVGA